VTSGPVLVTGAAGFAGSHLVELLAGRCELVAWARGVPPAHLERLAAWQRVDLLRRDDVRRAAAALKPAAVYHCAGASRVAHSWQNTTDALAGNVLTTHYLLDALRRAGIACRVLIPGSAMVYAPSDAPIAEAHAVAPGSPYAVSKLAQEHLGLRAPREDGIDVVVTRSFNHTGPRQSPDFAAPAMARQVALIERGLAPPLIKVGNLDSQRDLTDVRDVVRAYAAPMDKGATATIYNVASGTARTIRSVLDYLVARAGAEVRIETDQSLLRPRDQAVVIGDASRLRHATAWAPQIAFERMLDDLLNYWRDVVGTSPASTTSST
jgi:GDP-4-dehydro-6-deoxy-D-mannose reductase